MKILFIYRYCILGGVTTQLYNRLNAFKDDIECHFGFLQDYGGLVTFKDYEHVYILTSKYSLNKIIKKNNYDVISIIDTKIIYNWLKNIDYNGLIINEVHTTTSNLDDIKELKNNTLINMILTPSKYMKDIIENKYGFKGICKVEILPNCLDFDKFYYTSINKRLKKIIPILWVGKLDNHKKIFEFLRMAYMLERKNHNYSFNYIIVGGVTAPDHVIDKFINTLIDYNLLSKTKWLSSIKYEDMYKIYSFIKENQGVYVSTTINESFGMTVLEAMSIGLPVVVPSVGALCELPYDNEYSLYEQGNLEDACKLIIKQIGKTYEYNVKEYGLDKVRNRFMDIIDKYENESR